MEKDEKPRKKQEKEGPPAKPPGQFVSNDLEEQTARFIEEVKGLAKRRKELTSEERRGGPPPRSGGSHRSSRR